MIANAKVDPVAGKYVDGGNLEVKAYEILAENIYSYDQDLLLGAGFSYELKKEGGMFGNKYSFAYGDRDYSKVSYATLGKGGVLGKVNGALNRDVCIAESGVEGDKTNEIRGTFQYVNFDKAVSLLKETVRDPKILYDRTVEGMNEGISRLQDYWERLIGQASPPLNVWDVLDIKTDPIEEGNKVLEALNVDTLLMSLEDKEIALVHWQMIRVLVEAGIDEEEATRKVWKLVIMKQSEAGRRIDIAALPIALPLVLDGVALISGAVLAKLVGEKLAEEYPKAKEALEKAIREYEEADAKVLERKQYNDKNKNTKQDVGGGSSTAMPDPDDDDDWEKNNSKEWKVEKYDEVMLSDRHGKFYRDPEAVSENGKRLWWTKDTAHHSGHGKKSPSMWKAYEETETGLVHYRDVDKYGNYIKGKHKGPIGKDIPWKELRSINIKGR